MKAEERIKPFERGMEAWLSGDMERALSFFSPEVAVGAPDWLNVGDFRGHEGASR